MSSVHRGTILNPSGFENQVATKRVTWDLTTKDIDRKRRDSVTVREQLQSVMMDLNTTQADVELLKKDNTKMMNMLQQLLDNTGIIIGGQSCEQIISAHETLKQELVKLKEAQDKEAKKHANELSEVKNLTQSLTDVWEQLGLNRSNAVEEAVQALNKLKLDTENIQKRVDAATQATREESVHRDALEVELRQSLQEHGSMLKSHIRNQIAHVNTELRHQKNTLEREKCARESWQKSMLNLIDLRSKTAHPRQSNFAKEDCALPAMDNVAKSIAQLALQLEAEVATRAASIDNLRSRTGSFP